MVARQWVHLCSAVVLGALIGGVFGATRDAPEADTAVATVEGVRGGWTLGPYVRDLEASVGAAGGQVVVAAGELAGLAITVPAAAVPDGTAVTIEHAEIIEHTWGAAVRPVTPAIKVELGDGGYAERVLTVSVPVELGEGAMAMGLYVRDDGSLEGMPLFGGDRTRVDVATRHFSTWFLSEYLPQSLPAEISTGYQMARDNWNFVNYGSYVSPKGICAGMTLSSAWYFLEQYKGRVGAAPLYGQYDYPHGAATAGFQDDDAHAYRFASMVQADMESWAGDWATAFRDARFTADEAWQFQAFRYAMYLTGEPQFVTMSNWDRTGGHALLAYAVTLGVQSVAGPGGASTWHDGGSIWIADPNYPRQLNSIVYDSVAGHFIPYSTATSAGADPNEYPYIGYGAKSAFANWPLIGQRYREMLDGSIGTGSFPVPMIWQLLTDPATGANSWVPTTTPVVDPDGTVTLIASLPQQSPGDLTLGEFYEPNGTTALGSSLVAATDSTGNATVHRSITLSPGLGGHTYKLIVWTQRGLTGAGKPDITWVDALPVEITAAPPPTTTTTVAVTLPVTAPPTVPPTVPQTVPPATAPGTTYPCPSVCPPGIAGVECSLHCGAISQ